MENKPMLDKNIVNVNVVDEMKEAYGAYAMAVIVGRAIPDLYDGLKPVQRRILTSMKWLGLRPDARFMKSARVEGETMGKLHPQGGAYGALVNMAQWWTNNSTLVNGHGNFGSPTDGPAAARYTEAKLTEYAFSVLLQDSDTWETRDNYDGSLKEPVRFNSRVPHLLINGSEGIAVGMATRIPNHNLRGVAKALRFIAEGDMKAANKQLIPDFPTGCEIVKDDGMLEYLNTGRGSLRMRAVCERSVIDYGKRAKRDCLTFVNLPLHSNTEQVGEQIKDAIVKGRITTVADVRDETDRTGVRLVIVLKANVNIETAEQELYRWTVLDTKFSACNMAIDGTKPVELTPLEMLTRWMTWRDGRLVASLGAELIKRRERLEVVQGLLSALDMIDDIIDEIRRSKDRSDAKQKLIKRDFTDIQANAILDMRLSQLTKLDDKALRTESKEIQSRVKEILKLNSKKDLRETLLLDEIDEIATRHGNARRSKLIDTPAELTVSVIKQGRSKIEVNKPRFVKVDEKTGVLTQLRKLGSGVTIIDQDDKFVFVCGNGFFTKVGAKTKGPLFNTPTKVLFKAKASSLPEDSLIGVWKVGDDVFANLIPWEALTKTTSRGKRFLPEGAELIHLGGSFELKLAGRKKNKSLTATTLKARPVGGKGSKIAKAADLA